MKVTFDLQGAHELLLSSQGVIYEMQVFNEDGPDLVLEGSVNALHKFFSLGLQIIEDTLEGGGDPNDIDATAYFGPGDEIPSVVEYDI